MESFELRVLKRWGNPQIMLYLLPPLWVTILLPHTLNQEQDAGTLGFGLF